MVLKVMYHNSFIIYFDWHVREIKYQHISSFSLSLCRFFFFIKCYWTEIKG